MNIPETAGNHMVYIFCILLYDQFKGKSEKPAINTRGDFVLRPRKNILGYNASLLHFLLTRYTGEGLQDRPNWAL